LSRFVIHGGRPLEGEIRASGSKNAVLPMIAAAMLTEEEVVLENVPLIRDVDVMLEIAGVMGAEVSRAGNRALSTFWKRSDRGRALTAGR
jgi:UDP-N-acetylglucosamine 1-carboxyvinyltransferase